jgi:hypothetical protein
MLIPLGILASAGGVPPIVSDYELIATSILANNSSSQVQFTSGGVWADYKHLQLRVVAREYWVSGSPSGSNLKITLNNTASTYKGHFMRGGGASVISADNSVNLFNRNPISTSTSSSEFGAFVLDILDINSTTKNTTMRSLGGMAFSYGNWIELASSAWFTTDAITSIQVIGNAGTLGSGTRISLYGIKG